MDSDRRSQWQRGLRRGSAATRLLRLCVRIPPRAWIFVCCECCVLSGRGLCDELTTRPEEPYRLLCVIVCDLETSRMGAPYIYDISRLRVKPNIRLQRTPFHHNYIVFTGFKFSNLGWMAWELFLFSHLKWANFNMAHGSSDNCFHLNPNLYALIISY